jgi:hypothetical protein
MLKIINYDKIDRVSNGILNIIEVDKNYYLITKREYGSSEERLMLSRMKTFSPSWEYGYELHHINRLRSVYIKDDVIGNLDEFIEGLRVVWFR